MDLSSNSQNIEESFFRCSICQDNFTEPKLLPCFHRYCKGCLTKVVQVLHGKDLECPTCSQTCCIPDKGLDGFKTDYHMENMVEFQRIKSLFNGKAINDCIGCSNKSIPMAGYCFKCKDFLCYRCYQFHLANKMIADHKEKVISAKDCASDGFDLQGYIFLKGPQKCDLHVELTADLCCSTCNNLPVCLTCATVSHSEHNIIRDIKSLAAKENEKFTSVEVDLEKCKERYGELITGIEKANATIQKIDNPAARKVKDQHEREMIAIIDKTKEQKDRLKKSKAKLDESLRKQEESITEKRDKEIQQITEKYNNKLHAIRMNNRKEKETMDANQDIALQQLHDKQKRLEKKMAEENAITKQDQEQKEGEVLKLSEVVHQLAGRMNNYNATSKTVHVAANDWITIQCLPELHIACQRLVDDFERKSFELASILSTYSLSVSNRREGVNKVEFCPTSFYDEMSVIEIAEMKGTRQKIQSITSCGKKRIAITGYESRQNSFLALIDSKGKRKKFIKTAEKNALPIRFIASLSDSLVVTVSKFNLINMFNIQDWSLSQKDISKIIPFWGDTWRLSCVATDRATKEVYVGASNMNIYVFSEHLNFVRTLELATIVTSMADILILERYLLVCDESAKRAYIVTRQGGQSALKQELEQIGRGEYCPLSACTDKEGFIFMLWSTKKQGDADCRFAKYSPDGRTLITTGSLDKWTQCITILEQSKGGETLVAASGKSNKMYLYTLPRSTNPPTNDARSNKPVETVLYQSQYNRPNITDTSALFQMVHGNTDHSLMGGESSQSLKRKYPHASEAETGKIP
ncbi:uncharacterized protein [Apostichopus japonicus]|uniref:uncharacterized protein n=1 Tax=Stichopus japonicus TaxID=307972 RepID=UPI003AB45EE6